MTPCARVWWDDMLKMAHRCERPVGHKDEGEACECRCQPRWWLAEAPREEEPR